MCTSPLEKAPPKDIGVFGGGGLGLEVRRTNDQHLILGQGGSPRPAHVFEKMVGGKIVVRWSLYKNSAKSKSVDFWSLARENLCYRTTKINPKKCHQSVCIDAIRC